MRAQSRLERQDVVAVVATHCRAQQRTILGDELHQVVDSRSLPVGASRPSNFMSESVSRCFSASSNFITGSTLFMRLTSSSVSRPVSDDAPTTCGHGAVDCAPKELVFDQAASAKLVLFEFSLRAISHNDITVSVACAIHDPSTTWS